ncbi:unnamed protein product, partial [Ectocarpus sp. 12 AP-2014]
LLLLQYRCRRWCCFSISCCCCVLFGAVAVAVAVAAVLFCWCPVLLLLLLVLFWAVVLTSDQYPVPLSQTKLLGHSSRLIRTTARTTRGNSQRWRKYRRGSLTYVIARPERLTNDQTSVQPDTQTSRSHRCRIR